MFSTQWAAVSTSIGETTDPVHAVPSFTLAMKAANGHVPTAARVPPTTLA